jgi:hypothetical protein
MKKHLAIFVGSAIDDIISGRKTIESRFSLSRILPYAQVAKDDVILLKKSGGDVIGKVLADNVLYYDNLTPESIAILRKEYNRELCASDNFWFTKSKSRFGTLIFLKNPERFLVPIKIHKTDRRPWVVLEK